MHIRNIHFRHSCHVLLAFGAILLLTLPGMLHAGESKFVPLTGIPGVDPQNITLVGYLNALYILSIALGALFAVVKIAIAGVTYATSEIVTSKQSAKGDIMGALLGLGILLATYVVLHTINPNLTRLDILRGAAPVSVTAPSAPLTASTDEINIAQQEVPITSGAEITSTGQLRLPVDENKTCRKYTSKGAFIEYNGKQYISVGRSSDSCLFNEMTIRR